MYYDSADRKTLLNTMYASINAKEDTTTFKFSDETVYTQARDLLVNQLLDKAGQHLCDRYRLREVEFMYSEYGDLNRFVVYWKYE